MFTKKAEIIEYAHMKPWLRQGVTVDVSSAERRKFVSSQQVTGLIRFERGPKTDWGLTWSELIFNLFTDFVKSSSSSSEGDVGC